MTIVLARELSRIGVTVNAIAPRAQTRMNEGLRQISDEVRARRSNPNQLGVNVACLDGLSPFDFKELPVFDGERHPADDPEHRSRIAGTLTFLPA
jgi:NAD(P)-dependent dehydrogenase (short-subunit alcohol dehydrogenase family)